MVQYVGQFGFFGCNKDFGFVHSLRLFIYYIIDYYIFIRVLLNLQAVKLQQIRISLFCCQYVLLLVEGSLG